RTLSHLSKRDRTHQTCRTLDTLLPAVSELGNWELGIGQWADRQWADRQWRIGNCFLLVNDRYQLPITHHPLPITHYLLPITYYQGQMTNDK
ncbi:MAG: hypothetical protein SVX43_04555, partial [Cyanobacteriota bacterium]|nr:hypothetical protein [Cyanobacteriota bacterium]